MNYLKFGVVENDLGAATWKVKTQINKRNNLPEIYLICRELGGSIHTSLHSSGNWHTTFTKEVFEEIKEENNSRFIQEWPRPAQIQPGLTLAYKIITPYTAVTEKLDTTIKNFIPVPNSKKGKATQILFLLLEPDKQVDIKNAKEVGRLTLSNKEVLIIVYNEIDIPSIDFKKEVQGKFFKNKSKENLIGSMRVIVFGDSPDGTRILLDCLATQ